MNVTLIATRFSQGYGGIPRYAYDISEGLKKYCDLEKMAVLNSAIIRFPPSLSFINMTTYLFFHSNLLRNKNIHVLEQGLVPARYLELSRKKILTLHDLSILDKDVYNIHPSEAGVIKKYLVDKTAWKLYLERSKRVTRAAPLYDHIITVSETSKEDIIKKLGIEKDKITIVYPIVDNKFRPLAVNKSEKTIIGYINSYGYDRTKYLKIFISAFKEVKDNDLELHLYGRGFTLQDFIKDDKRIKYLGFAPEKDIVYITNTFSVFLSTSSREGFGSPIMQAKGCRVPVMCYDGDLPKIIKQNTLLWNESNVKKLIEKRAWEMIDTKRAAKDIELCRSSVVIPQIFEIYKKIFEQ